MSPEECRESPKWLSKLPEFGYQIKIVLKNGDKIYASWGRLLHDNRNIHLAPIERKSEKDYPFCKDTKEIPVSEIKEIWYKDDFKDFHVLR